VNKNYEWISAAISHREIVVFDYHGYPRHVVPGHFGVMGGDYFLIGYQIGGSSHSGTLPDWRWFRCSEITNPRLAGRKFNGFPPGFKRDAGKLRMKVIWELS
jgi:hypothetical protein